MRIALSTVANLSLSDILSPNGCESYIETLFRSETVLYWQWVVLGCILESLESNLQATMIGNVLTLCQATIAIYARSHLDVVVEVDDDLSTFLELLSISLFPPVFQVTVLVVLTTLIIESVSHFMTNHHTDSAIVEGIVSIHVEERILQNTSREANLVGSWVIISIHGLRSHPPLSTVNGLAITRHHVSIVPLSCTLHILIIRIILDFQG